VTLPRARLWRILFWTALVAILIEVLGLASTFNELRRRRAADAAALAPDQIAAVVHLWPRLDAAQREDVLRAISWSGLSYRVASQAPAPAVEDTRVREVEAAVRKRLGGAQGESVVALIRSRPRAGAEPRPISWALSTEPLRVYVRLTSDEWLVAEARGELGARFFGLPTGFWAGVLGLLLAAGVLLAILREGRAIERIARSLEAFAKTGVPRPLTVGGSPEVAGLARRTLQMQQQVATLLSERTTMLGALAHDIKTYIQRMKLRLELLDDPAQVEKAARDLDAMNGLVEDALLIAVHANPLRVEETFDLFAIVAHEVEAARLAGGAATLCRDSAGPFLVAGDPSSFSRALSNVIGNALRYGNEARVAVREKDLEVEVIVDDAGPGIPAAERDAVFAAFHRGESSRSRKTGGAGLGLTIALAVVERHGGSIEIMDAPGGGARVRLGLPISTGARSAQKISGRGSP